MDKGVAGFRFSAVGKLYENIDFLDEPYREGKEGSAVYFDMIHKYTSDQPEVIDTILEWRQYIDNYSKRKNTFSR